MPDNFYANDPIKDNPQMKQYFNSLPAYVQESIKQSGIEVRTLEDLRSCAENMMK